MFLKLRDIDNFFHLSHRKFNFSNFFQKILFYIFDKLSDTKKKTKNISNESLK
jgi:hypothetical protein